MFLSVFAESLSFIKWEKLFSMNKMSYASAVNYLVNLPTIHIGSAMPATQRSASARLTTKYFPILFIALVERVIISMIRLPKVPRTRATPTMMQ